MAANDKVKMVVTGKSGKTHTTETRRYEADRVAKTLRTNSDIKSVEIR